MINLVICLVFIIFKAEALHNETENPVIRLDYNYDRNENFTVLENKPMKIVIENSYARYIWCYNFYANTNFERFVAETPFANTIVSTLNVTHVTTAMNTRWACVVLQEYHGPPVYTLKKRNYSAKALHFNLHVKGARPVILTANNHSLTYVTTNLSVNYDGEANHTYEDGEDMDFSCEAQKPDENLDSLRLEYYNAEGIILFRTKFVQNEPLHFRSVLKLTNNKYYLDCVRAANDPKREYRYRTTFYMKKRDLHDDPMQHGVILSVNGQKIPAVIHTDTLYDDYVFRYIDGEVLNVTCQKTDINMKGTLTLYGDNTNIYSKVLRSPSEGIISLNISTSNKKKETLGCRINNTNVQKSTTVILFLSDVPSNDVRIRGLPRNNVLYQYTNGLDQWTIEYQYSVNDTLNLTCVSNRGFGQTPKSQENLFQWTFEGETFGSPAKYITPGVPSIEYSEKTFTKVLNATRNGTKIKCVYNALAYNKTVEIILRLKPELVSKVEKDEHFSEVDPEKRLIVPIAAFVGVVVAVITMVCLVCWRKRTKRVSLIENAYDNLSNQDDSLIPAFPSQWEANFDDSHYTKIDEEVMQENCNYSADNDKLYSTPYNRQSNTSENYYTEIDEYLKPKLDGMAANLNTAQPSNYIKGNNALKQTSSQNLNNASFCDPKQGTYDRLRHNNLPNNNSNGNYSNVQKPNKGKTVTFGQISNDLKPGRNHSEGYSRQDCRNNDTRLKQNSDGLYANTGQDIHMQPGVKQKKHDYENHSLQNEKACNSFDLDYAEPYSELEINCKNDFYG